ncbi:hypothetical protein BWQ96_07323 [Gracilariopsis chorda]|uniref:Uncharacterized protein n=1 Tax=Gracilariopsis chorda TaxID=448386 RepID=A0A2V3ILI5_9FLOR|nr:hypothetical protein BWQ96_07323 [Gracilariopsis chorda]|eukprot:PXF42945.1 hypothetical protein BWQ96_07323 [Gracilariopsis chorda]
MTNVVDLTKGGNLEKIDVIESDSEDSDFASHCKRNIPSRKPKIVFPPKTFFTDLQTHTNILQDNSPIGMKSKRALTFHLTICCRNEHSDDNVKCFITNENPGKPLCNVLFISGVVQLEPRSGDVIIHPDLGVRMTRMASKYRSKKIISLSEGHVDNLIGGLIEML